MLQHKPSLTGLIVQPILNVNSFIVLAPLFAASILASTSTTNKNKNILMGVYREL